MGSWAQWTAKTALLAAGFPAAVLGDSTAGCVSGAPAGTGSVASGPLAGLQPMSGPPPIATAPAPRGLTGEHVRRTFANSPSVSGAGDTNVPAALQPGAV